MLFKKKEYLSWDKYNKKIDSIEHLLFLSSNFRDYWKVIK